MWAIKTFEVLISMMSWKLGLFDTRYEPTFVFFVCCIWLDGWWW